MPLGAGSTTTWPSAAFQVVLHACSSPMSSESPPKSPVRVGSYWRLATVHSKVRRDQVVAQLRGLVKVPALSVRVAANCEIATSLVGPSGSFNSYRTMRMGSSRSESLEITTGCS